MDIPAQNGINCVQIAFLKATEYLGVVPMPCVEDVHKALMIPEGTRKQDIPTLAIMYLPGVKMTMITHPIFAHEGNNWVSMIKETRLENCTVNSHRAYAPHTISYMNILHFKICRACYHDLKTMLDEMQYQDVVERLHFKDIHQLRHAVIDQVFIGQKTFSYQPGEPPNERF